MSMHKRILIPLIVLAIAGVSLLSCAQLRSKVEYNFDNGHVRLCIDSHLNLVEDYSYAYTTSLIFSLVDNQNPSGILTLQVYSDKQEIEAKSALELFEEDQLAFEASNFIEIETSTSSGGHWSLISNKEPMEQLYLVCDDERYTAVLRVLTTPELFSQQQEYYLNLLDLIDVYGLGVLTPGEQIHEYFEKNS